MNFKSLSNEYLLLDTNVLVNSSKYSPFYDIFFDELKSNKVTPILDDLVKFEFLRGAESFGGSGVLKAYLVRRFGLEEEEDLNKSQFSFTTDTLNDALKISNIYQWKLKNNKIELVDCIIAAQLKSYNGKLKLATENHDDFPNLLFDRIGIKTIDTEKDIHNVGFYKFNEEKYSELELLYKE